VGVVRSVEIEKRFGDQLQLSISKKRLPRTHYCVLLPVEVNVEKQ
jgi:hypothetical protein